MIEKQDRAAIRKICRKATDSEGLVDHILETLPHLCPMQVRHFMQDEADRVKSRIDKRNAKQAAFERAVGGLLTEFAKHPPGTTLGELHDMEMAARDGGIHRN